jgi:hypothetical protein
VAISTGVKQANHAKRTSHYEARRGFSTADERRCTPISGPRPDSGLSLVTYHLSLTFLSLVTYHVSLTFLSPVTYHFLLTAKDANHAKRRWCTTENTEPTEETRPPYFLTSNFKLDTSRPRAGLCLVTCH